MLLHYDSEARRWVELKPGIPGSLHPPGSHGVEGATTAQKFDLRRRIFSELLLFNQGAEKAPQRHHVALRGGFSERPVWLLFEGLIPALDVVGGPCRLRFFEGLSRAQQDRSAVFSGIAT